MSRPMDIAGQLENLPPETREQLDRWGFDADWFIGEAAGLADASRSENHVRGSLEPPAAGDIVDLPDPDSGAWSEYRDLGDAALAGGGCAQVVLAGGMATRMGGVVKALVEALPGRTFLDLRLASHAVLEERLGRRVPFWLMTSHATDEPIRHALGDRLDGYLIATFPQSVSLRLNPDGSLFTDPEGVPSAHSPGHGDLPDALRASGLLDRFIEAGGTRVTTANLDNIGATLDPVVIGMHIAAGTPVACEVVEKMGTDKGGIPARLDGRPVMLEEFRIPDDFDPSQVRVFNSNTFHFTAPALADLDIPWTYFVVHKEVDGTPVIQFERLINEVTSHLDTIYIRVPRQAGRSRFLPVKDEADLALKQGDLEAVARDRGVL